MGPFTVAKLLAGVCLMSLCAADLILYQPNLEGYQLVRTRRQAAPHVNVHSIPKTSFSCNDKKLGEYYADMETRCQVYHICLPGVGGKLSAMSFVCPNGTIFSQASRVCNNFDRVYCQIQERFYESLHGDLSIQRTDYGNLDDYAKVKYNPVPVRATNNDISEEDYDDEPATPAPPPPPRRQQAPRPSGRNTRPNPRPIPQAPPAPEAPASPPPQTRRQPAFRPQAPPPPPPQIPVSAPEIPPPQPPPIRRQPSFRTTVPVQDEPETTSPPQRSAAPTIRRPVFRNQVSRGPAPTTTEEPTTTTAPNRNNLRSRNNQNRANVRVVPVPVIPLVPQPPPVDLSIPTGVQYAQPQRGPNGPTIRLPPALRSLARPVFFDSDTEAPAAPTEIPQSDSRPAPFVPNFARPAGVPLVPITRPTPPPPTQAPSTTTQVPTEAAPTTTAPIQGNNNNDYEYVYDYDFNPTGNTRSKRYIQVNY